jgi:hypothetical protein
MDDIYVYIVDLKSSVPEMVTQNPDGSYTVILNARYSYERQRESYRHACRHIERCDFEKMEVQEIEKDAHKQEPRLPAAKR